MGVSVAEYYGQRTDVDTSVIHPIVIPEKKQVLYHGEMIVRFVLFLQEINVKN